MQFDTFVEIGTGNGEAKLYVGNENQDFNHIIVYNYFGSDYHSVVLLSKC